MGKKVIKLRRWMSKRRIKRGFSLKLVKHTLKFSNWMEGRWLVFLIRITNGSPLLSRGRVPFVLSSNRCGGGFCAILYGDQPPTAFRCVILLFSVVSRIRDAIGCPAIGPRSRDEIPQIIPRRSYTSGVGIPEETDYTQCTCVSVRLPSNNCNSFCSFRISYHYLPFFLYRHFISLITRFKTFSTRISFVFCLKIALLSIFGYFMLTLIVR